MHAIYLSNTAGKKTEVVFIIVAMCHLCSSRKEIIQNGFSAAFFIAKLFKIKTKEFARAMGTL